jgi:hypothetical protein
MNNINTPEKLSMEKIRVFDLILEARLPTIGFAVELKTKANSITKYTVNEVVAHACHHPNHQQ